MLLLAGCPTLQWRTFVQLAVHTGCRLNELRTLTWDRVHHDAQHPCIEVLGKRGRDREQPIRPDDVPLLQRLQVQTQRDTGPFDSLGSRVAISLKFGRIARKAGVRCRLHDLRATFLTDLHRAGVSVVTASKLAGHSSINTTAKYYLEVTEAEKRAAIAKLA